MKPPQKHAKPVERRGLFWMWDARFCFVAFCDVEQEEEGDTLTHTFIMPSDEPPEDPPTSEWPFYEPWGDSLTTYNWWTKYKEPEVPNVSFAAGIITVENPGYEDCGIVYGPPSGSLPLCYGPDKPLKIAFNNTECTADSTSSQILHELIFRKNGESMRIYLCINCGAEHDFNKPWNTGYVASTPFGWLWVGTGEDIVNLLDWFITFRNALGLDANPEGWTLETIAFALGTQSPACTDHLKSDYLGCYLPQESTCNMQPWNTCETRYFYFWATNMGEKMVSTSPIFSKHYGKPPTEHTDYFHSDAHPEVTSVDGHCWRDPFPVYEEYDKLWVRNGTNAEDDVNILGVRMLSDSQEDLWRFIYRAALYFDTSSIPEGSTIISAKLRLQVYSYQIVEEWEDFEVAVVGKYPLSYTALVPADYNYFGDVQCSTGIKPGGIPPGGSVELTFIPRGLALIKPAGITTLGLRDMGYDCPSIIPDWLNLRETGIIFRSADNTTVGWKPRLEVTYQPPPGEYDETYDTDDLTGGQYTLIYNRIEFKQPAAVTAVKVKTKNAGDYTLRVKSDDGSITYQTVTVEDAPADSWITFRIASLEVITGLKYRMEVTRPQAKAYASAGLYDGYLWKNNMAGAGSNEYEYTFAMGIIYVIS